MANILVIDDNQALCELVSRVLLKAGHEVGTAFDGATGEGLAREPCTDLVVTDVIMPDREGLEVILNLKKTRPELPIIAMSGGGRTRRPDILNLAQRLGADRVLRKPLDRLAFLNAVRDLLAC